MKMPWDKRGTLTCQNLPNKEPESLMKLSDYELYVFISGWREGTADWIAGQVELRRRENAPARWAIGLAILSLVVSVIGLFVGG